VRACLRLEGAVVYGGVRVPGVTAGGRRVRMRLVATRACGASGVRGIRPTDGGCSKTLTVGAPQSVPGPGNGAERAGNGATVCRSAEGRGRCAISGNGFLQPPQAIFRTCDQKGGLGGSNRWLNFRVTRCRRSRRLRHLTARIFRGVYFSEFSTGRGRGKSASRRRLAPAA
jgi:hypothetical protein